MAHRGFFMAMQRTLLSIVSSSDHISDAILIGVWFTKNIPIILPLMGLFSILLTSIVPIFLFNEWYVKMAMPFGFGN